MSRNKDLNNIYKFESPASEKRRDFLKTDGVKLIDASNPMAAIFAQSREYQQRQCAANERCYKLQP